LRKGGRTRAVRNDTDERCQRVQILKYMSILARSIGRCLVGRPPYPRARVFPAAMHYTDAHPCGEAGFCSSTLSPIADFDTDPSEFESQIKRSRKRRPFSLSGSRVAI